MKNGKGTKPRSFKNPLKTLNEPKLLDELILKPINSCNALAIVLLGQNYLIIAFIYICQFDLGRHFFCHCLLLIIIQLLREDKPCRHHANNHSYNSVPRYMFIAQVMHVTRIY